jgi:E3 ubiquitin-protein ligase DCST1
MYYFRFIHVLSFDNVYATKLLKRYDRHCSERGGAQLFPLRPREKVKIIDSVSLSMSQFERKALLISLVLYMVQCIVTIILYVADWTLYTFMEIIIRNVNESGSGWNETATFRVDSINFELNVPFSFDAKKCLVVPRKVSEDSVIILVVVYIILGFAVLSQAYCLRFRHAIAAYFYPERNSERVQYLYNKLLRKRERSKMTLKFQFSFRKANSVKTIQIVPEPAVPGFCKKVKPNGLNVLRKIGLFRRYCFICGFPENSEFKQCKNFPDCSNIYCPSCFDDRNNTCIVCDI